MADIKNVNELVKRLGATVDSHGSDPLQNQTTRREALRLARLVVSSLENPVEKAFETPLLPTYTLCSRVAVQLGIFPLLVQAGAPVKSSELVKKTGAEHLLIVRVMRMLCAMGVVKETAKEEYEALPVTHAMASRTMEVASIHMWDQGVNTMAKFPKFLEERGLASPHDPRNGVFQFAFDTKLPTFEYWHQIPKTLDTFNTLMEGVRNARASWVEWFPIQERILDGADPTTVLLIDNGGGRGHDIEAFQKKYPQSDGKLVLGDLPAVIDDIKQLNPAIAKIKIDFFQEQPIKHARAYYFSHIFHDWSDEPSRQILRSLKPAFKANYSKLLLNEFILPDTNCSFLQAGFDINMMIMHGGIERTESQWTELLDSEGFRVIKFWSPPGGDGEGIVEAELA